MTSKWDNIFINYLLCIKQYVNNRLALSIKHRVDFTELPEQFAAIFMWTKYLKEKGREFQKNIYFCIIDYTKAFDCVDHNKLENS